MIVAVVVIVDASRRVFLDHIRGDEMRKEEATKSARRCQEQRDKGPDLGRRHASALLPLTSAARFRPPRTSPSDFFSRRYRKHCPFFPSENTRARARSSTCGRSLLVYPPLVTWTLVRQLSISVLMFLVGRAIPRLHRVHQQHLTDGANRSRRSARTGCGPTWTTVAPFAINSESRNLLHGIAKTLSSAINGVHSLTRFSADKNYVVVEIDFVSRSHFSPADTVVWRLG